MAEDIKEEGSEEKKQGTTSQGDDDDFGLPDLEFDELDDLDLDFEDEIDGSDEEDFGDIEEAVIIDEKKEITSEDAELPGDQGLVKVQEESSVMDEEDSGLDFSAENNESKENMESVFASDPDVASDSEEGNVFDESEGSIFGDNDIEVKEEFQSAEEAELPSGYKPYSDEGEKGGFAKIIIFGAIGVTLIGLVFLFMHKQGEGEEKVATKKTETVAKAPKKSTTAEKTKPATEKVAAPTADNKKPTGASEKTAPAPKPVEKVSKPASSAPSGEIINVQEKTGRSYIIIGSFIDDDLANDFAKELSADGKGAKILFPYGKSKRYRVSVADFDSYSDAAAQIETYKSTYGDGVWALKY